MKKNEKKCGHPPTSAHNGSTGSNQAADNHQPTEAMTTNEIIDNAYRITVINDGSVRYPVTTDDLRCWEQANGPLTDADDQKYMDFCGDVSVVGDDIATPGNEAMDRLCTDLLEAGADLLRF